MRGTGLLSALDAEVVAGLDYLGSALVSRLRDLDGLRTGMADLADVGVALHAISSLPAGFGIFPLSRANR